MSAAENETLIRNWLAEWDKGNFSVIYEYAHPDLVFHLPGGADLHGPDEFREAGKAVRSSFPDLRHTVEDVIAAGDKIVFRLRVEGTHKGEYLGIAPTGKAISYSQIAIYRVSEGKCVEGWTNADSLGLVQQLGAQINP